MNNKKHIVIVGASRGIGNALVKLFANDGNNHVLALSRNKEELFKAFPNVQYKHLDLENPNLSEEISKLFSELPQIDVLINNAGKLVNKSFEKLSLAEIQSCYQVNVIGVMQTVQKAIPLMKEHGGHIVNISSMGGFQGTLKFAGLSAYSTSKAAVCSFTELFAEEYKDSKIKMNCLCLGAAQTEMLAEAFPGYLAPISAEKMAEFIHDFSLTAHQWMNGKIIPVSLSTP